MENKKFVTIQQKLGFADDDLKKPKHDEMMLWLDQIAENIINSWYYEKIEEFEYENLKKEVLRRIPLVVKDRTKVQNYYNRQIDYYEKLETRTEQDEQKLLELKSKSERETKKLKYLEEWTDFENLPPRPGIKLTTKVWEYPITTQGHFQTGRSSKYTVGFIDMSVTFKISEMTVKGFSSERILALEPMDSLRDISNKIHLGFDLIDEIRVNFEVKTEIKSLGELLRQVQLYREYSSGKFFIVADSDLYRDVLWNQGVILINWNNLELKSK